MLKLEVLKDAFPGTPESTLKGYVEPLINTFNKYEINTQEKIACFVAQVGHESGGFRFIKENLNYSAEGLQKVFKKYFPDEAIATLYARKPDKIANRVYANRMGNGDEASGDGFRFCGRGLIQLTGKDNYTRFAQAINMPLDKVPAFLETPEGATLSAGWFWSVNGLNPIAEKADMALLTKKINGGTHGLGERMFLFKRIYPRLAETA